MEETKHDWTDADGAVACPWCNGFCMYTELDGDCGVRIGAEVDMRRRQDENGRLLPARSGGALLNEIDEDQQSLGDVMGCVAKMCFEVVSAQHQNHEIDGLMGQQAGEQVGFSVKKIIKGVIPDRRSAIEPLLDHVIIAS